MRRLVLLLLLLLLLTGLGLGPARVAAQACLGQPVSEGGGIANLTATSSLFGGGLGFGTEMTVGRTVFLQGAFDYYRFADSDRSEKSFGGSVVVVSPTSTERRVSWCPRVALTYRFGLEL